MQMGIVRSRGLAKSNIDITEFQKMLFALLFDQDHRLAAVALACDQQPYSDRYWTDIYASLNCDLPDSISGWMETAYIDVEDPESQNKLMQFESDDTVHAVCQTIVDRRMGFVEDHVRKAA